MELSPELVLTTAREGTFLLPAKDNAISRQIIEAGIWAQDDVALFRKLVRPGDGVLDVGANIGHHSVVFSRLVGANGRVYAFEPQQRIFNFLCANLALNECHNVRPFQLALGDECGFTRMCPQNFSTESNWGALPMSKRPELQLGETVEVSTVDRTLAQWPLPVRFVKIDVQTFELFVLRGAQELIRREHPTIFVEISPYWMDKVNGYDHREIYALLRGCGYRLLTTGMAPFDEGQDVMDPNKEWDIIAVA
jgi:FkbM family methyltransferase